MKIRKIVIAIFEQTKHSRHVSYDYYCYNCGHGCHQVVSYREIMALVKQHTKLCPCPNMETGTTGVMDNIIAVVHSNG